jgi:primase-polymerase (primpol)-like protein
MASANDPKTWATFDQANRVYSQCKGYSGLGFVFSKDDPFIGLDWDNIRDPVTGIIDETILSEEILPIGSYAEISPSCNGVHVIGIGSVPGDRRKGGNREMYDSGRYFTMTGWHIEGAPLTVEKVSQETLNRIYTKIAGNNIPPPARSSPNTPQPFQKLSLADEEVLLQCLLAKNSDKFRALYERGDLSGYGSQSEADLALCAILAFYTSDTAQIDRIFRQSRLYRPKWDESRGSMSYGARTILEATTGSLSFGDLFRNTLQRRGWKLSQRIKFVEDSEEDLWKK